MDKAREIAAGLSEAQPKALKALSTQVWLSASDVKHKCTATSLDVLYQMNRKNPLCERRSVHWRRSYEYRLTPLGLTIRTILLEESGDAG